MHIVKGDTVVIVAGKHSSGKQDKRTGKVLWVDVEKGRVLVEKFNLMKRHTKPNQKMQQGGIIEREASIDISNVMLVDPKTGKPTRVGVKRLKDGTKVRVARRSGEIIPKPQD